MPVYSADALVLRTYRYGEADRIVVFLTQDRGKKRGVAKHASASRRRFGAALEPLTLGRATYVEREQRELVRLERIEPQAIPLTVADGTASVDVVRALGHSSYFAELLDEWAPDGAPNERLFRLGSAVAAALGRRPAAVDGLARYFEYWLLRLEGVYPALDRCARCAASLSAGAMLDLVERSYVCRRCGHGETRLSRDAMAFLVGLGQRTPDEVTRQAAPRQALLEIEHVHHRLIAMHLEKTVRSARVVKELGTDL